MPVWLTSLLGVLDKVLNIFTGIWNALKKTPSSKEQDNREDVAKESETAKNDKEARPNWD